MYIHLGILFIIGLLISWHFALGFLVGFFWTYFNILQIKPVPRKVSRWQINNGRLSFLNFVVFLETYLNKIFNRSHHQIVSSAIRVLTPTAFFVFVVFLTKLRVHWWWIFFGSLFCEIYFNYRGRDKILIFLERFNMAHKLRQFL